MKNYLPFEDARAFVRKLKLKSRAGWIDYCKSGNKPDNIPINLTQTYKKDWISWGDFLGTFKIANQNKEYLSFYDARKFIHLLKLNNKYEWKEYCNSGKKPDNIPNYPNGVYKNSGWLGLGDWLGTNKIATFNREYLEFEQSRDFVRKLNLKSQIEWNKYRISGNKPDNIPSTPDTVYKNKGWVSWGDWLGTKIGFNGFLPFEDARFFVRNLKLKSTIEWKKYCKSGNKPDNIPSSPIKTYKNNGWVGIGDWLGTFTIAPQNMEFLPFEEARFFVRNLKLKSRVGWIDYCNSGKKPDNIPNYPNGVYKNKGWVSLGDWLGTKIGFNGFLPFEEARKFVRNLNLKSKKEWSKYCKLGNKPDNIPIYPDSAYKNKGWTSWGDWFGTFTISNQNKSKYYLSKEDYEQFINQKFSDIQPDNMDKEYEKYWIETKPINLPRYPKKYYLYYL